LTLNERCIPNLRAVRSVERLRIPSEITDACVGDRVVDARITECVVNTRVVNESVVIESSPPGAAEPSVPIPRMEKLERRERDPGQIGKSKPNIETQTRAETEEAH
jgi:hypothetical protein